MFYCYYIEEKPKTSCKFMETLFAKPKKRKVKKQLKEIEITTDFWGCNPQTTYTFEYTL